MFSLFSLFFCLSNSPRLVFPRLRSPSLQVPNMLSRINLEKQGELYLLCKHFLDLPEVDVVRVQAIDRLGVDLRVKVTCHP